MKKIILFDADTQHYRQSIYKYFAQTMLDYSYQLIVVYDRKLNNIEDELFIGIDYSFSNFVKIIKKHECNLIISFVWLKYKFILPFLMYCRLLNIKTIVWSHGINLQKKKQVIKNQLYYLRQRLAHALIIFSKDQLAYIVTRSEKVFIANNTLNFKEFPNIPFNKDQLKEKYSYQGKWVILCVGRMNTNNRKTGYLIELANKLNSEFLILLVGPGVSENEQEQIAEKNNIQYLGPVYDNVKLNELYKLSDLFCMPGAIGLSINQAFYYGLPVIVENVNHGPEITYFQQNKNGYFFPEGNIDELKNKIEYLFNNKKVYHEFSKNAQDVIKNEASLEKMFNGFLGAINYVQ
jgi:glycosyltransferase involved in cell wall biosynthesis